jgi:hypothetical protein
VTIAAIGGTLLLALGATVASSLAQESKRRPVRAERAPFQLFAAGDPITVLDVNAVQCGIDNQGNICTDVFNSPTGAGGYWPTGTADSYIFNNGLQFAGINSDGAGPWAGDTVAAYFFDERGTQQHASSLNDVFDSRRPEDAANWPDEARVSDTDIFAPSLIGRIAASEQDSWVQYWDGDPTRAAFRQHPMGVKVTQRSLAWNTPLGNESIVYFVLDIENVTAEPSFQDANELEFFSGDDRLPNEGWTIDSMYAAVSTDFDVGSSSQNFSTAIMSFDIGITYHGGFLDQRFSYPPRFFKPPFFVDAPGLVGIRFLKTPVLARGGGEAGYRMFSTTQSASSAGAQFIPPLGDDQLWRYLSGNLVPALGDPPCNVQETTPTDRPVCFVFQQAADTRFFQSTGPFSLDAGETETIVIAYMMAATVETMPDGSPSGIRAQQSSANANPPGFPSYHPGFASSRGCDVNGQNCTVVLNSAQNAVQPIERGAGWYRYTGPAPATDLETSAGKLDPFQVEVVPESLLGKALVAQTIFEAKFQLSLPPTPPRAFLAPADGSVTILWETSPTESAGDPFYVIASDPNSALYNPNYRRNDIEGYRIYRGTRPDALEPIAQFDYAGTTFTDRTCETVMPFEDVGVVADVGGAPTPVKGYLVGEDCPLTAAPKLRDIGPNNAASTGQRFTLTFNNGGPGGPPGGGVSRVRAAPVAIRLDTVRPGTAPGDTLDLVNNGVPFVFADTAVTNNFTYYYAVTAFDVNSMATGPFSTESGRQVQSTVPRVFASNLTAAFEAELGIAGDDGVIVDTELDNVQPDSVTGVFPSPQPPTNALDFVVLPPPEQFGGLLSSGGLVGRIDSIIPRSGSTNECPEGTNALNACWEIHTTFTNQADGTTTSSVARGWTPVWDSFGDPDFTSFPLGTGNLPWDDEALQRYGIPAGFGSGIQVDLTGRFSMAINYSVFEGQANRRSIIPGSVAGGSRWFDGPTETRANPTRFIGAGRLGTIDSVWKPVHHTPINGSGVTYPASSQMQCFGYTISPLGRAADVRMTWGGGTFAEVRDVTHNVDVPFSPKARASYGFLTTDSNGNGFLDWQDFDYLDGVAANVASLGFCALGSVPSTAALAPDPVVMPISTQGNFLGSMSATGTGFALYINAERYFFEPFATAGLPGDGRVWTLRTYSGVMASGGPNAAPTSYVLTGGDSQEGLNRPPMITGLEFRLDITQAGVVSSGKPNLAAIHTVPDPYLGSSRFDIAPTERQLMFVNMPAQCTLRIYSLSGVLIRSVNYRDQSGGGRMVWDMTNRSGQAIASGVYFFQVTTPEGDEHVGRFTVITGAGQF